MHEMHSIEAQRNQRLLLTSMWNEVGQTWGKGISYLLDTVERHDGGSRWNRVKTAVFCASKRFKVCKEWFCNEKSFLMLMKLM